MRFTRFAQNRFVMSTSLRFCVGSDLQSGGAPWRRNSRFGRNSLGDDRLDQDSCERRRRFDLSIIPTAVSGLSDHEPKRCEAATFSIAFDRNNFKTSVVFRLCGSGDGSLAIRTLRIPGTAAADRGGTACRFWLSGRIATGRGEIRGRLHTVLLCPRKFFGVRMTAAAFPTRFRIRATADSVLTWKGERSILSRALENRDADATDAECARKHACNCSSTSPGDRRGK